MTHDYIGYYTELARNGQIGGGIAGFHGVSRYQQGYGFLGDLFKQALQFLTPTLKEVGKQALTSTANIVGDVLIKKRKFKDSAKEHLKQSGNELLDHGIGRVTQLLKGEGRRKRFKAIKARKSIKNKDILKFL